MERSPKARRDKAQLTYRQTLIEIRRCAGVLARQLDHAGVPHTELQRIENLASVKLGIEPMWPVSDVGR